MSENEWAQVISCNFPGSKQYLVQSSGASIRTSDHRSWSIPIDPSNLPHHAIWHWLICPRSCPIFCVSSLIFQKYIYFPNDLVPTTLQGRKLQTFTTLYIQPKSGWSSLFLFFGWYWKHASLSSFSAVHIFCKNLLKLQWPAMRNMWTFSLLMFRENVGRKFHT